MPRQTYWIVPQNSASQVDKAGDCLIAPSAPSADLASAWDIVENWRAAHAYPLKVMASGLRDRAQRCNAEADVAQRLKRKNSITSKLMKERRRLSAMQDIGGCRAIVSDIPTVRKLAKSYLTSKSQHELGALKDYILEPRASGYRGIHLPYKFRSKARPEFNGLRIELQLRTRLQHHWATAVETAGLFLGQDLKGSRGQAEWLRFFALMSSVGAGVEKTPPVPDTPNVWAELRDELSHLSNALHVTHFLQGLSVAVTEIQAGVIRAHDGADAEYYVLQIDAPKGEMKIGAFRVDQLELARQVYEQAEEEFKERLDAQAVLISVAEVAALPRAYPNFYGDTTEFLRLMKAAAGGDALGNWRLQFSEDITVPRNEND